MQLQKARYILTKVEGALLLDIVVAERAAVFELLPGENQALLVGRNALLVLDLALDIVDGVARFHLEGDGFARDCAQVRLLLRHESVAGYIRVLTKICILGRLSRSCPAFLNE